ncbi:bifunctional folylpolyglutamate synthase/dihydrofolate synthase [Candidatus Woesearchaeota archaeon]|nr:bifunctional folylpolyglutamate synthase/dihydrofolate synthase [Candidatus Woesearchaeota archaeon]
MLSKINDDNSSNDHNNDNKSQYKQIIDEIFSYESKGIVLGLERIKELLAKLGNPEKNKNYIHISGTNGKGSVTSMCAAILQEAGYKVGMHTSPHLYDVRERIQINYKLIPEKDFIDCYLKIKPFITNQTFFEVITAIAFLYFHKQKVDFIVLEVGLGGEYDATNVIKNTLVSVITNVELDHLYYLGDTREKIAKEKTGIIKRDSVFVSGISRKDSIFPIIEKKARQEQAIIIFPEMMQERNLQTALFGEFQKGNTLLAKTAIVALQKYGFMIDNDIINAGLMKVRWPGRMQFLGDKNNILLDCAHNPAGIACLVNEINILKKEKKFDRIIVVFGVMKDKQYEQMITQINEIADVLILTHVPLERSIYPEELIPFITKEYYLFNEPNEAFAFGKKMLEENEKKESSKKTLLLVCGSCYLIGSLKI